MANCSSYCYKLKIGDCLLKDLRFKWYKAIQLVWHENGDAQGTTGRATRTYQSTSGVCPTTRQGNKPATSNPSNQKPESRQPRAVTTSHPHAHPQPHPHLHTQRMPANILHNMAIQCKQSWPSPFRPCKPTNETVNWPQQSVGRRRIEGKGRGEGSGRWIELELPASACCLSLFTPPRGQEHPASQPFDQPTEEQQADPLERRGFIKRARHEIDCPVSAWLALEGLKLISSAPRTYGQDTGRGPFQFENPIWPGQWLPSGILKISMCRGIFSLLIIAAQVPTPKRRKEKWSRGAWDSAPDWLGYENGFSSHSHTCVYYA